MSPTVTQSTTFHPQRPWRAAAPGPRHPGHTIVRPFVAPVVRELPVRRDATAATGGAW